MPQRPYEVMIIFDTESDDQVIRATVDRVLAIVREGGGTPGQVARWGRRTLAYEVRKRVEGYYVLVEATAEPPAMTEVDRLLTLADAVLRHKMIRIPEHVLGRPRNVAPPPVDTPASEEPARRRSQRRESQEVA